MTDPRLIAIAAFLKRHLPVVRKEPRAKLLSWLQWYWKDARVGVVRANGRIVSVALARGLDTIEEAAEGYCHHEGGKIIWIEHIVSLHPAGMPALMSMLVGRFGTREVLAGHVFSRDGELRKLPWSIVDRFLNRGLSA